MTSQRTNRYRSATRKSRDRYRSQSKRSNSVKKLQRVRSGKSTKSQKYAQPVTIEQQPESTNREPVQISALFSQRPQSININMSKNRVSLNSKSTFQQTADQLLNISDPSIVQPSVKGLHTNQIVRSHGPNIDIQIQGARNQLD